MLRFALRLGAIGGLLIGVAVGSAVGARHAGRAIADMDFFRVAEVEISGIEHLDQSTVMDLLAIGPDASVWDDPTRWVERLEHNALVADVSIRRALPRTLVVRIEESRPVALIPTPTLSPIDAAGRVLPLDPAENRLDLPLLQASLDPADAKFLSSRELQTLLEEVIRLGELAPDLAARVSSIGFAEDRSIGLELFAPDVTLLYRAPATAERLEWGIEALRDARRRRPDEDPRLIDLRFDRQVVVRFAGAGD